MNGRYMKRVVALVLLALFFTTNTTYAESGINKQVQLEEEKLKEAEEVQRIEEEKKKLISEKIPMPVEHQEYLYNICRERGLDYVKTLAIIRHESGFNHQANSRGINMGYMQIHKGNQKNLAKSLKTEVKPFDPYVNMNWGTHMLSNLYKKFQEEGLSGDKLDRAVWSSYNKGEYGFRKSGEAKKYIERNNKHIKWIRTSLGLEA